MSKKARSRWSLTRHILCGFLVSLVFLGYGTFYTVRGEPAKTYMGAEACGSCHEKEYKNFMTHSKKSHSFKTVATMKKRLTEGEIKKCFECHTTGYGKPGGFQSESETPHLKDLSCEVCHGPGSAHVQTGDPKAIKRRVQVKDCEGCHNAERVAIFNFRPLLYGGVH
jgi:hypothetical protein